MGEDREEGAERIGASEERSGASPAAGRGAAGKAGPARRVLLWLPVALMMGTEVWLSSQSRLPGVLPAFPGADKLEHAVWFFLLGLLAWRAGTDGEGWSRGRAAVTIVLAAALWGASDEWHQSFVPGRSVEAADVASDVAGTAVAALVAEPVLRRLRPGR